MEIKHQALGNKFYDIMKSGYMKKWKNLLLAALLIFYHLLSHPDFQSRETILIDTDVLKALTIHGVKTHNS